MFMFPLGHSTDTPTQFRGSFRLTLYDAHRFKSAEVPEGAHLLPAKIIEGQ